MKTVFYSVSNKFLDVIDLAHIEPVASFKEISEIRNRTSLFLKCPAVQDIFKNTYTIKSPFDLTLMVDESGFVQLKDYDQEFFDAFILPRTFVGDKFKSITIKYYIVFYSESDIVVEQLPAFMEENEFTKNTRLIPGKYNIGRWVRPIEIAFEVCSFSEKKEIKIKRGDALCYIRFLSDEKLNLSRKEYDEDLDKVVTNCSSLKKYIHGNSLMENYNIANNYLKLMRKKIFKKRCPFSFLKGKGN